MAGRRKAVRPMPPISTRSVNNVLRIVTAIGPNAVDELLAALPLVVSLHLTRDLQLGGESHRYDVHSQCAYYIRQEGEFLQAWRFDHVATFREAGRLLAAIASLDGPLTEERATELFTYATTRTVSNPRPSAGYADFD